VKDSKRLHIETDYFTPKINYIHEYDLHCFKICFLVPTIAKYNCIKENNYLAFRNTYLLLFPVLV